MPDECSFDGLIERIRRGDDQAAEILVRRYEAEIRREVRLRLRDPLLRPLVDSVDICQSVMGSFFVRAAAGQYELQEPAQLLCLLVRMAHNKIVDHQRRVRTARRYPRGEDVDDAVGRRMRLVDPGMSPSQAVSLRELLAKFRQRLSPEESRLADLRSAGRTWVEISRQLGGTAESQRKRLARVADRVCEELGLDVTSDA